MTTEQIASTLLEIADFLKKQDDPAKPEPAFTLPPCAPGMEWHRPDGWKPEDLPHGWRPLINGERSQIGDNFKPEAGSNYWTASWQQAPEAVICGSGDWKYRTRRPLIFTHAGKQWTWHRPGDPCPVPGNTMVHVFTRDNDHNHEPDNADDYEWGQIDGIGHLAEIIGWRYADETKTVPLGPEDVMPFTVIRRKGETETWHWRTVSYVDAVKVTCGNRGYEWDELASDYERNESLPLTGRWNPDAWEPCHKPA